MEFEETQIHGNPSHRPMVRIGLLNTFRYSDEERERVLEWMIPKGPGGFVDLHRVPQPSGYVGMVPKGIPLRGPKDAEGTMDYIEVPEDEWPMDEKGDWW